MLLRKYIAILCAVLFLVSTGSAGAASAKMDISLSVDLLESVEVMPCHDSVDDQHPTNACAEHSCSSCLLGSVILSSILPLGKITHTSVNIEQATSHAVRLYLDGFYRPPIIS